ncbi:hypothetical protein FGG08_001519 [Glutinoglossum americanum]|uniref:UDP-galactose transporter n=1 Tax=Glutinoglossum americanum TaxID=1670608 RepID=A0A9P8L076_9PEZI|nr:hypothetical protein FGG08_001519 [Glutinoglossum americanum]
MPLVGGNRFLASTAVFLNEVAKLAICLTVSLYDISRNLPPSTPATSLFKALYNSVFTHDSWKLAIPASLYTLQNTLQYVAVSNLDAATFQVTYQLKILTTALFSVTMLHRSLTARKWISLVLLTIGVAIVQLPSGSEPADASTTASSPRSIFSVLSIVDLFELGGRLKSHVTKRSATYEGIQEDQGLAHPQMNATVGLIAVIIACTISGLAGVYFEKVLKDSNAKASLWIRNVQLSFYSLFPAFFIGVVLKDGEQIAEKGFFMGYNYVVWTAIAFQALGGVVVALCVNYADNIAKNFATSISIIVSCLASIYFFDFKISFNFLIGGLIVMFATYLYSSPGRRQPSPDVASYEKTVIETSNFENQAEPTTRNMDTATTGSSAPTGRHTRAASDSRRAKRED